MIVCHCQVVSDRHITAALRGGARSLSEICRSTGAGSGCGTCVFSLKQLVCQHEQVQAPQLPEEARAAS